MKTHWYTGSDRSIQHYSHFPIHTIALVNSYYYIDTIQSKVRSRGCLAIEKNTTSSVESGVQQVVTQLSQWTSNSVACFKWLDPHNYSYVWLNIPLQVVAMGVSLYSSYDLRQTWFCASVNAFALHWPSFLPQVPSHNLASARLATITAA